jgi:CheY-like chemotaxis protein
MMLKTSTVPPDAPRRGRAARVMVVDDNAVNSNLLRAYCKKKVRCDGCDDGCMPRLSADVPHLTQGCDFAMAENGEIAVQVFENQTPGYWE